MKCVLRLVCEDRELTVSAPNYLGLWNKDLIFIQMLVRFYLFATGFDHWVGEERAEQACL